MTLPIQIAAIGAGILFAFYLLFRDRSVVRAQPLTYNGYDGHNRNNNSFADEAYDTHPLHDRNNGNAKNDCLICLSEIKPEDKLRKLHCCEHVYHDVCIKKWLEGSRTCPLCRKWI